MDRNMASNRLKNIQNSVFLEFAELAKRYKPLNIGLGYPDFTGPEYLYKALSETALKTDDPSLSQYARDAGLPRLVNVLSKLFSKLINRSIDPQNEIIITCGAYEALFCTIMGMIGPGDEVIIIEPFFDCYLTMTQMVGGIPVIIPLRPKAVAGKALTSDDWVLDPEELESKFSSKTKFIIVNTPHNPLGKIFSRKELEVIGNLCKKYNCIAVMDEVYEWVVFNNRTHIRMSSLPDMWDRTITIGSGGKSFSVTGWRVGWAYGPQHLLRHLGLVHQNSVCTIATPIQEALAIGFETELQRLGTPEAYWNQFSASMQSKRDRMYAFLSSVGIIPTLPEGGYFMIADMSKLVDGVDLSSESGDTKDYKFAQWMSKNKKLQAIPVSAFYSEGHKYLAQNYLRFCFIKKDETLDKVQRILNDWKQMLNN